MFPSVDDVAFHVDEISGLEPFPMIQSYKKECRILLDTLESFRAVP